MADDQGAASVGAWGTRTDTSGHTPQARAARLRRTAALLRSPDDAAALRILASLIEAQPTSPAARLQAVVRDWRGDQTVTDAVGLPHGPEAFPGGHDRPGPTRPTADARRDPSPRIPASQ